MAVSTKTKTKMTAQEIKDKFQEILARATTLREQFKLRDTMLAEIRQMFHMEWQNQGSDDWIKASMSPSAYNAAIGAVRLLNAAGPQFNVPFEEADPEQKTLSELIETAAKALWHGSGGVTKRPPHHEISLSSILYAEICGSITKTADLLDQANASTSKGNIARMTWIANETPYLFKIYNPDTCYPDVDFFGLRGLLRRVVTTWGEVLDTWGKAAQDVAGISKSADGNAKIRKREEKVTVNDWYDYDVRAYWLDEAADKPIYLDAHGLGFMPVVSQVTDGSYLFDKPELQRFPFLYSMWKSGLWKRENLTLTAIFTLVQTLAVSPQNVLITPEDNRTLVIDRSVPGGVIQLKPGEDLKPLLEKIFDPSLVQALTMAQQINEQSTISRVTLGGQPNTAMPYSSVSLLAASGRVPLVPTIDMGGLAIADMVKIALRWIKADKKSTTAYLKAKTIEIKPADIPDRIVLHCTLEPDIPTDKLQQANIVKALTEGATPSVSQRWARENILNIGQSANMDKEIWMEKRLLAQAQLELQRLVQQVQQSPTQPSPANAGAGAQGPYQMSGGGQPQGEQVSPYPDGGVQSGQPLTGPLPPQNQPAPGG